MATFTEPNRDITRMYTSEDLAEKLNLHVQTVRKQTKGGILLKPVRIGRQMLWRPEEVEEWISAGCPTADEWIRIKAALSQEVTQG